MNTQTADRLQDIFRAVFKLSWDVDVTETTPHRDQLLVHDEQSGGAEHCDDTLAIEAGPVPVIWPSDRISRPCSDSNGRLEYCLLTALYLLKPAAQSEASGCITRRPVAPTAAIPALMPHVRMRPIHRREDTARITQQLGVMASSVPVFELSVSRDSTAVKDVVLHEMFEPETL